jgi:hypothetical protein
MTDLPGVTYIETTLPSGPRARMWLTENCFVLEVNGLISHCSRQGVDRTDSPERIAELVPLLAAASAPL